MFDSRRGAVFAVAVVLAAGALVGVPKGEAQVSGTSSGVSAPAAPAPALPAVASGSDGPPSSIPPASGVGPSATAEAAAPVSATTPAPSARLASTAAVAPASTSTCGFFAPDAFKDYRQTVCNDGPVSYWPLDGAINGNDLVAGNLSPVSYTNGTSLASGEFGQAVGFDGVSGGAYVGSALLPTTSTTKNPAVWRLAAPSVSNEVSVEAWIKPTNTTNSGQIFRWRWYGYSFGFNGSGQLAMNVWTQPSVGGPAFRSLVGGSAFDDGAWHHVASTFSQTEMAIYVDGVKVASQLAPAGGFGPLYFQAFPIAVPPTVSTTDPNRYGGGAAIGRDGDYPFGPFSTFGGGIDELAIFNKALSQASVTSRVQLSADLSDANSFGDRPSQVTAADPVNVATGNLVEQVTDLDFGGATEGLSWGRSYNSLDAGRNGLGRGWSLSAFPTVLNPRSTAAVKVKLPDGREVRFLKNATGAGYQRPDEMYANLVRSAAGLFELRGFDGSVWRFNANGKPASFVSALNHDVTYTYDASGRLTSFQSETGLGLFPTYNANGTIAKVQSSDGRTVTYAYDASANLASVTDPAGFITRYTADAAGRIVEEIDPAGIKRFVNIFDSSGRVVQQTLPGGEYETFVYNPASTIVTSFPTGEATTYAFDSSNATTSITDSQGQPTTRARNDELELTSATDRLGKSLAQSFDANGNLLSSAVTGSGTASYTYDGSNRVLNATSSTGAVTTFTYMGANRIPATITDGLGGVTTNVVVDGLVTQSTDADDVVTKFTYDAYRELTEQTDATGAITRYAYDPAGRMKSMSTPLGFVTTYVYTPDGRLVSATDPTGAATSYTYDAAGRVSQVTDPQGSSNTYSYDTKGRRNSVTDARGAITSFSYNDLDDLVTTTRPGGTASTVTYGVLRRATGHTDPLGRTTTDAFDSDGNIVLSTDPVGAATATLRDTTGRATRITDPLGRQTNFTYDAVGRMVSTTVPTGASTTYGFDILSRPVSVTDARGGITRTSYTAAGRTKTSTDALNRVTSFGYDTVGRRVSVTNPLAGITATTYDADSRGIKSTSPTGLVSSMAYDAAGRLVSSTDPAGVVTTRSYNLRGQITAEQTTGEGAAGFTNDDRDVLTATNRLGGTVSYSHDPRGNLTQRTDPLGRNRQWTYDLADQTTSATDALNRVTSYTYDGAGRIASTTDGSGRTTTFTYDLAGQVTKRSSSIAAAVVDVSFTYDGAGRRLSMVDPSGTTGYTYDQTGNLTQVIAGNGDVISYQWNLAGERTALTYPDGALVAETHDANGRLTVVAHPVSGSIVYTYDADGRVVLETLPDSRTRSRTYTAGRLTGYVDGINSSTLSYDATGRVTAVAGPEASTSTYDAAGQLVGASKNGRTYTYGYDGTGTMTASMDSAGSSYSFGSDASGQLISITSTVGTGVVSFDGAGRLVSRVLPGGENTAVTYDPRGLPTRLVHTKPGSGGAVGPVTIPYPLPTATGGPVTMRVEPIFECWAPEPGGTWSAYFSYENLSTQNGVPVSVTIPLGNSSNKLSPPAAETLGLLPIKFGVPGLIVGHPGRTAFGTAEPKAFVVRGWRGSALVWKLDGKTATAPAAVSAAAPKCAAVTPPQITTEDRSYDGDGTLTTVKVTAPNGTSRSWNMTWDPTRGNQEILSWTEGTARTSFVYGLERATAITGGVTTSFGYSPLGDAVDGAAGTVASGEYGPYGTTGTAPSGFAPGFGYRGELHLGDRVHLRARDLDTRTGRFDRVDPLPGSMAEVVETNEYHYANNDPTNRIDPSGLHPSDATFAQPCRKANVGDFLWAHTVGLTQDFSSCDVQRAIGALNFDRKYTVPVASAVGVAAFGFATGAIVAPAFAAAGLGVVGAGCATGAFVSGVAAIAAPNLKTAAIGVGVGTAVGCATAGIAKWSATNSGGVNIEGANFAQNTAGKNFSAEGAFSGAPRSEIAGQLLEGTLTPGSVPVEVIVRNGQTLILNTRSATALAEAGIPRSQWTVVNLTGNAAAEARLTAQLARNGLTGAGTPTVKAK